MAVLSMSPSLVTSLLVTRITFVWALLAIEKSSNVIANVPSGLWNRATVPFAVPSTSWNVPVLTGAATLGAALCSIIAEALGAALCSIIADADGIALCSAIAEAAGDGGADAAALLQPATMKSAAKPIVPTRKVEVREGCT